MARDLKLSYQGNQYIFGIKKLDRKKIYGYTVVDVRDENGSKCSLATVSDDGQHILAKGCVGYTYLNERNEYVPNSSIKMVDKQGNPIEKIISSFDLENIELEDASLDDYLKLYVKSVYQLTPEGDMDFSSLLDILKSCKVLYFKFNYRTDYDADDAFLLQNDDAIFMVIGQISEFQFIGLEKVTDDLLELEEDDEDDFDFGML